MKHDLQTISGLFRIPGLFISGEPYGTGHINDTYKVTFDQSGTRVNYIFQRINHNVFKQPAAVSPLIPLLIIFTCALGYNLANNSLKRVEYALL